MMNTTDAAAATVPRGEFPTHGLMPRTATQVADFVRKYPLYDGRGVVAAVLDTGIDPGAKGLQETSDGKRKVLDYVDCTGGGDVELTVVQAEDGAVLGASGRRVRLNKAWSNPTGEWRVGAKQLKRLVPEDVWASVSAEREERFRKSAQELTDAVAAKGEGSRAKKGAEKDGKQDAKRTDGDTDAKQDAKQDAMPDSDELDAQADVLKTLGAAYADQGPLLDCVVFHDGTQWRAAIDVDESGDLSTAEALGAYKHTGDVGTLVRRQL
ncbi:hypothetical protein GGF43_005543, partial [Coemansia sp. RSA 2618]